MRFLEIEASNRSILKATYFAMSVSFILALVKFLNYYITGSTAIHGSALDSLLDIGVSFANFLAIKITQRRANESFPYGYDKIASLIAFLQVIFVAFLAFFLFEECFEKLINNDSHVHAFGYGVIVILFAMLLNTVLVWYQSRVVKLTGSLVIRADMVHYKTDFFTNFAILVGLFAVKYLEVQWLDPIVGMISGIYLLFAIYQLGATSLSSLLDVNNKELKKDVIKFLQSHDIKC